MAQTLEIGRMSVEEKFQAMEALWQSLRQDEDDIPVPQWHKDLLDERARKLKDGTAEVMDWETAKKWIADEVS